MLYRINKSITIEGMPFDAGSTVDSEEHPQIQACIHSCLRMGQIEEMPACEVKPAVAEVKEEVAEVVEEVDPPKAAPPLAAKAKVKRPPSKAKSKPKS
jgi:hypothetical protein